MLMGSEFQICGAEIMMLCSLVSDVVTALTADGLQFTHPLHHLGKTVNDLPLVAIDSFKHMYLWPHNPKTDLGSVYFENCLFTSVFCLKTVFVCFLFFPISWPLQPIFGLCYD